jgi:hypothetical protein
MSSGRVLLTVRNETFVCINPCRELGTLNPSRYPI